MPRIYSFSFAYTTMNGFMRITYSHTLGFFVSSNLGEGLAIWKCTPNGEEWTWYVKIELGQHMENVNIKSQRKEAKGQNNKNWLTYIDGEKVLK